MAKNKIITSQGNVQFINSKGKTISMHPMHCYAVYQDDTVSFLFIYMKEYSGQAFFASQFEDLEVDGETYDSIDALKEAIAEAFAKAGAQARTEIVDELPETGYTNTIYLLPKEHGEGYDEYIYNEEKGWQLIGDTDIEFERYLEKTEFYDYSAATEVKINYISGAVDDNASDIQFLSGAVDTEISDREAADAVISGAVDTLSTNLSNEVQRAQNAEQTLQNNINTANARIDAEQIARANADNALSGAIDSVDDKIEALSGEVQTMGDEAIVDAEYVSSSTTIDFYNASGAVVAQVDATDFIADGMIDDVRIETISGVTYLVIDFNTASGKEDIKIPLTDIFNPDNYYDKTAVDALLANKANSADVYSKSEVYTKAEVDEAIAEIDLSEYYTSAQTDSKIAEAVSGKVDTTDFETYSGAVETALSGKANASDVYTKSEVYTKAEVDEAISEIDLSDYYNKTEVDGKLADKADLSALTEDERVWGEALNDLNSRINTVSGDVADKADVTALTQVNNALTSHTANTNVHVTSAEKATWNGKQNALVAGENITISGNVISATGGGSIDVDNALSPTSENPVQNKVLFDELRITESEGSETKLIWEEVGYNDFRTTNFPSGYTTIKVDIKDGQAVGFNFINSNNVSIGSYLISNTSGVYVGNSFDGSTYTIDDNNVTITWDASKDVVELSTNGGGEVYDYMAEFYAIDEPVYASLKEVVSGKVDTDDFNTYSGAVESRIVEDEEVTAAGINAVNDKFGGLKLMKITQAAYDALTVKDNNTLYIISD